ncbi:hypothetical protein ETU10_07240 [Apibacter muscae]|uniref:hypothetical protein n=1 Tax=Apibacter muscae TaxID=2509004 RepID=UPI0011AC0060|nr:hypothetical protein [Apibacter muscae]TWP23510.1 hypothetical protein ETU10_07240 [Apibacter muscae]
MKNLKKLPGKRNFIPKDTLNTKCGKNKNQSKKNTIIKKQFSIQSEITKEGIKVDVVLKASVFEIADTILMVIHKEPKFIKVIELVQMIYKTLESTNGLDLIAPGASEATLESMEDVIKERLN